MQFFKREDEVIVVEPHLINKCSYCEREYDNGRLKRTLDHIVPLNKKRSCDRKWYHNQSLKKLSNIIDCCEECNCLKSNKTVFQWLIELTSKSNRFRRAGGSKKTQLDNIRIKNLTILINTKPEPYTTIGNLKLEW